MIFPGRQPVFVELKTDTGRLTALQKVQIDRLRSLGQDARVVRGAAGVKAFLEELKGGDAE